MTKTPRFLPLVLAVATVIVAAGPAGAQETAPPPVAASTTETPSGSWGGFGAAHQWVYSMVSPDEFPFRLTKTGDGDWGYALRPSADYFIVPRVSVGGIVSLSGGGNTSDIGIGVRAGYNLPITSLVSFWPRGGIYYHHRSQDMQPGFSQTLLDISAPFLFHLVPHFFLGGGPIFQLPIRQTGGGHDATYGLTAIVGGWL